MGKPTILLIEDESLLRQSFEWNLTIKGFDVTSTGDSGQGLALLRQRSFDLLITDYLMEGMTGIDVMKQARKIHPRIKVLVISGYADPDTEKDILDLGADGFLFKPVALNQLLEQISRIGIG